MIESDSDRRSLPIGKRGQLASVVATAVDTVAGARRTGGTGVEAATQYAGGRALGVQLGDDQVVVHLVAERLPLDGVVEDVRSAVVGALQARGDTRSVVVAIDDLDLDTSPEARRR